MAVKELIVTAAQALEGGRLDAAAETCRQILAEQPEHVDALNMLGIIACEQGQLERGVEYLRRACALVPDEPAMLTNLCMALAQLGRLEEAATHYRHLSQIAPRESEVHAAYGDVLRSLGRADEAEQAYRRALDIAPDHPGANNSLGMLLAARGDAQGAAARFRKIVQSYPEVAPVHANLAKALLQQNDYAAAEQAAERAVQLDPALTDAYYDLADALMGRHACDRAIAVMEKLLQRIPGERDALIRLGPMYEQERRFDEALAHYRGALQQVRDAPDLLYMAARFFEETNRGDEAERAATLGLALAPQDTRLSLIAARCERRAGRTAESAARLHAALAQEPAPAQASALHFELGKLYDAGDEPAKAWQHMTAANRISATEWRDKYPGPNVRFDLIERSLACFTPRWVAGWRPHELPPTPRPLAFLVAFPRSGTTLLDQILDGHSAIEVVDETEGVSTVRDELAARSADYPAGLARLGRDELLGLRARYFDVLGRAGATQSDALLIDKTPFNLDSVGLIHRLFPQAKIILALRHPLDVCLSCFMQHFGPTPATANFYDIETTARFYAATMQLWQRYAELLQLDVHRIRYEDTIADVEGETRRLLEFLDLPWEAGVLDYASHALTRSKINSPSYQQVTRPIYKSASGRWQRYASQLAPIRPIVAEYIEAFGYPSDP